MNFKSCTFGLLTSAALLPASASAQNAGPHAIPAAPDAYGLAFYVTNCPGMVYGPCYNVQPCFPPFQGMIFAKPMEPVTKEQRNAPDPRPYYFGSPLLPSGPLAPPPLPPGGWGPQGYGYGPPPWQIGPPPIPRMIPYEAGMVNPFGYPPPSFPRPMPTGPVPGRPPGQPLSLAPTPATDGNPEGVFQVQARSVPRRELHSPGMSWPNPDPDLLPCADSGSPRPGRPDLVGPALPVPSGDGNVSPGAGPRPGSPNPGTPGQPLPFTFTPWPGFPFGPGFSSGGPVPPVLPGAKPGLPAGPKPPSPPAAFPGGPPMPGASTPLGTPTAPSPGYLPGMGSPTGPAWHDPGMKFQLGPVNPGLYGYRPGYPIIQGYPAGPSTPPIQGPDMRIYYPILGGPGPYYPGRIGVYPQMLPGLPGGMLPGGQYPYAVPPPGMPWYPYPGPYSRPGPMPVPPWFAGPNLPWVGGPGSYRTGPNGMVYGPGGGYFGPGGGVVYGPPWLGSGPVATGPRVPSLPPLPGGPAGPNLPPLPGGPAGPNLPPLPGGPSLPGLGLLPPPGPGLHGPALPPPPFSGEGRPQPPPGGGMAPWGTVWSTPRLPQSFQVGPDGIAYGPGGIYYGPTGAYWGPDWIRGGPGAPWLGRGAPGGMAYGPHFSGNGPLGTPRGWVGPQPPPPTEGPVAPGPRPGWHGSITDGELDEGFGHGPWDRIGQQPPGAAGRNFAQDGSGFGRNGMGYGAPRATYGAPGGTYGSPFGPDAWLGNRSGAPASSFAANQGGSPEGFGSGFGNPFAAGGGPKTDYGNPYKGPYGNPNPQKKQGVASFPVHPCARSPRDFFMSGEER